MDENTCAFDSVDIIEQADDDRMILADPMEMQSFCPVIASAVLSEQPGGSDQSPARITIIHEHELEEMMDIDKMTYHEENEPMTFGESVTLLIALGVLLYLIYALLWPHRF